MKMRATKTRKYSGWLAKVSRVLIYTMAIVSLYQWLYSPQLASAAITNVSGTVTPVFNTTSGSLSLPVPTGSIDDLLLMHINFRYGSTGVLTTPTGWTELSRTNATTVDGQVIYYKWATTASEANVAWNYTGGTGTMRAGGAIHRYSGVDKAAAPAITAANGTTTASVVTATGLSTTVANSWIVTFMGQYSTTSIANPTGMTSVYVGANGTSGPNISSANLTIASAGATGNKASATSLASWVAHMVELKPAPSGDALTATNNTAIATSPQYDNATGVVMQRFQVDSTNTDNGTVELSTLTLDDTGTATSVASAKVYIAPTNSPTTLPSDAVLLGSVSSWPGTSNTVITLSGGTATDRTVTFSTGTKYIYIVYDMASGQAGNTVRSSVTAVGVASPDSGVGTVGTSNSLTLAAAPVDPSKINSCAGCHGYKTSFVDSADGVTRDGATGQFPGSHQTHVVTYGKTCSVCHTAPTTEGADDYAHRDGTVQIASPINGLVGSTYTKASFSQANSFSPGSCSNTYCHSNGTSIISGSVPANTSASWGSSTITCESCHGVGGGDDGRPNYANNTPKRNTHGDGASYGVTHKATECTICHVGVSGSVGAYTVDPATHNNGAYNLQATFGYNQAAGTCASTGTGCHGTTSVTWGGNLRCIDCHASVQGSRDAVTNATTGEFGLNWGHKKSGRGAVTDADCIVCHLEGSFATQAKSTLHGDGNIDLRAPDTEGEVAIKDNSGNAFTFTKFAFDTTTRTSAISNSVADVITHQFCLKCHDSGGATNTTARAGTSPSATAPFGGGFTALDTVSQFALTNSSRHPVLGPLNKDYPATNRMNAPYNQFTRTVGTKSNGVILNCFDCHNTPTTPMLTRTVSAHGNAVTLRGNITGASASLCITCHAGYNTTTSGQGHATGSAFGSANANTNMSTTVVFMCSNCHLSVATPVRPAGATDVHGTNALPSTGATKTGRWLAGGTQGVPIAFVRNTTNLTNHQPKSIAGTAYTANCSGMTGGASPCTSSRTNCPYTPGGTY